MPEVYIKGHRRMGDQTHLMGGAGMFTFNSVAEAERLQEKEDEKRRAAANTPAGRAAQDRMYRSMATKMAKKKGYSQAQIDQYSSQRQGEGVLDDIRNAFKPKNIAKAFEPVKKFADKTGVTKFVTKTLPSTLIHKGIPMAAEFVGSKFGVGKQARELGEKGAKAVGKVSGLGFKKGSPEMKEHMAKLRSMRKK